MNQDFCEQLHSREYFIIIIIITVLPGATTRWKQRQEGMIPIHQMKNRAIKDYLKLLK